MNLVDSVKNLILAMKQVIKEFIEKYGMGRDWSEFV
jgi:hypothetical protein